jgi:hypothetical protein
MTVSKPTSSPRRAAFLAALLAGTLLGAGAASGGTPPLTVRIATPIGGAQIRGSVSWRVEARGGTPSSVAFAVDGRVRWRDRTRPFLYGGRTRGFDTRSLVDGTHVLEAIARRGGSVARTRVRVTIANNAGTRRARIYWGAYMEGQDTYGSLYGGSWTDAPWGGPTWDRFEANAGKRVSIVHYGQPAPWERAFDPIPATLVVRRGAVPAIGISTKRTPHRTIADGAYDASITAWARAARAWGRPFFLLWDVEMNGWWEPYSAGVNGNTAADFVRAWRHVHDLVRAAGATNVTWVWCPNVDPWRRFTPYEQLYPGDRYVDWTGLNGYNQDGTQSFRFLFEASYRRLLGLAPGKPIMISQTSSVDAGKAAWITDALGTQLPRSFPRIQALVWFNWRITEEGRARPWPIESSPDSQASFRRAIGAPYFAPGGSFRLRGLEPVRPLTP